MSIRHPFWPGRAKVQFVDIRVAPVGVPVWGEHGGQASGETVAFLEVLEPVLLQVRP